MILSQLIPVLVFIGCVLVLSLALGSLALHLPRLLLIPRWPRFLVGACLVPFVIPMVMVTTAIIMPAAPRSLFLCLPPALAFGIIIIYGRRILRRLRRRSERELQDRHQAHLPCVIYFLFGVAAVLAIGTMVKNSTAPLMLRDILEYAGNGLLFATKRSAAALRDMGFNGAADGSLRGYMHSYAWPLYLSYAIMFNGGQPLGYPWDQTVGMAMQWTIGLMGLAVMALVRVRWPLRVGALALMIMLAVPNFSYITVNYSRDAFRIIPLLLLITALCGLSPHRASRRLPLVVLLPLLLFSAMSLIGHTLGGIIVMLIFFAWVIWILQGRQIVWGNIVKVALAIVVGLACSSAQYVEAFTQTGMIDGNTIGIVTKPLTIAELPATTKPVASAVALLSYATRNIVRAIMHDGHLIGLAGTITALVLTIWYWPRPQAWRRDILPFLSLVTLFFFLPFAGVLNIFGVKFSDMMFSNPRYFLHWYPVSAVIMAAFLLGGNVRANSLSQGGTAPLHYAGWLSRVKVFITVLIGFVAVATVSKEWVPRSLFNYKILLEEKFMPIIQIAEALEEDERFLLEDNRYNYYLKNRAMVMFTQPARWIASAATDPEAEQRLAKSRIVLLALEEKSLNKVWADTAMLRVARKKCKAPMRIPSLYGYMRVFVVGDFAAYYNRIFDRFDAEPLSEDRVDRTMFIDCYVNEVVCRGAAAIDDALSDQRKRASKHSPWHYIILGRLLEKSGRPADAEREYRCAKEFWTSSERYPSYYDEMNLARAWTLAATGETGKAASAFNEIAHQTASPLLRAAALGALDRLPGGKKDASIYSMPRGVISCHIPASWMTPNELFWKSFMPKTTYYKLAPIRGCFTMSISESEEGEILRVMTDGGARLGSDYIQVGLWLPERRSWVLQDAANNNQCLPILQPNAALYFSAAVRLSSTNENARLLIRNFTSSVGGSRPMMLGGTDWVTSSVSCVVASDFKESRWCSRYLASLPFDRLPGRWCGLAGLASFVPDEQKYAPVIEWTPKSTNAWLEVRDARLLFVVP